VKKFVSHSYTKTINSFHNRTRNDKSDRMDAERD